MGVHNGIKSWHRNRTIKDRWQAILINLYGLGILYSFGEPGCDRVVDWTAHRLVYYFAHLIIKANEFREDGSNLHFGVNRGNVQIKLCIEGFQQTFN